MTQLGQLLELLHNAHGELDTFQAEYRDWVRPRPSSELIVHRQAPDDGHPRIHWRGAGPSPTSVGRTRRLWHKRPDCLRVEVHIDSRLVWLGVLNRARWWRWDATDGADTSEAPAGGPDGWWVPPLLAPPLLEPARLLASLRLTSAGCGMRAGRAVLRACAQHRRSAGSPHASAYELEFDAEHGTMLRHAVFEGGDPGA